MVTLAGRSCMTFFQWRSPELIFCIAYPSDDLVQVSGPVAVATRSGGQSAGSAAQFTFAVSCGTRTSQWDCKEPCKWCVHKGRCAPADYDCEFSTYLEPAGSWEKGDFFVLFFVSISYTYKCAN